MNQDPSATWHHTLQHEPMLVAGDDDFTSLFQLGIDFPGFDEAQTPDNGFDPQMGDLGMQQLAMGSSMEELHGSAIRANTTSSERNQPNLITTYSKSSAGETRAKNAPSTKLRHDHHQQRQQQQKHVIRRSSYESRIMVPPTPQSSELQGAAARYYHYLDGDGLPEFDSYQRHRDDQVGINPERVWS